MVSLLVRLLELPDRCRYYHTGEPPNVRSHMMRFAFGIRFVHDLHIPPGVQVVFRFQIDSVRLIMSLRTWKCWGLFWRVMDNGRWPQAAYDCPPVLPVSIMDSRRCIFFFKSL